MFTAHKEIHPHWKMYEGCNYKGVFSSDHASSIIINAHINLRKVVFTPYLKSTSSSYK